jgi:hypothetical protein
MGDGMISNLKMETGTSPRNGEFRCQYFTLISGEFVISSRWGFRALITEVCHRPYRHRVDNLLTGRKI